jgi:hypothetical protein
MKPAESIPLAMENGKTTSGTEPFDVPSFGLIAPQHDSDPVIPVNAFVG